MSMVGTASGVNLKFKRATQLCAALSQLIQAYFEAEPFVIVENEESNGDLAHILRIRNPPPLELSTMLGDVVHNTRSALGHLAWQLVLVNGRSPSTNTEFPIAESEKRYTGIAPRYLAG